MTCWVADLTVANHIRGAPKELDEEHEGDVVRIAHPRRRFVDALPRGLPLAYLHQEPNDKFDRLLVLLYPFFLHLLEQPFCRRAGRMSNGEANDDIKRAGTMVLGKEIMVVDEPGERERGDIVVEHNEGVDEGLAAVRCGRHFDSPLSRE